MKGFYSQSTLSTNSLESYEDGEYLRKSHNRSCIFPTINSVQSQQKIDYLNNNRSIRDRKALDYSRIVDLNPTQLQKYTRNIIFGFNNIRKKLSNIQHDYESKQTLDFMPIPKFNSVVSKDFDGHFYYGPQKKSPSKHRLSMLEKQKKYTIRFSKQNGSNNEICMLCQKQFLQYQTQATLSCKHFFHQVCIDKWYRDGQIECPKCEQIRIYK